MSALLVLFTQAVIFFAVMAIIFHYRSVTGIGVFYSLLGTMHFLETYLAAVFVIQLPLGLITPGSTVMFTGKLAFFLLLYVKEDAESMRQPIFGLLIGNSLIVVLATILRIYATSLPGYSPELPFLEQVGALMVWGTILLFVDLIALVIIYERFGAPATNSIPGRLFVSLSLVLSLDQILFYGGLSLLSDAQVRGFLGGWIVKMGAAAFFSLMLTLYLRFFDIGAIGGNLHGNADVFDRLTYRHRYEQLAERIGLDALTGLQDRGRFDIRGLAMLRAASQSGQPISLMMIDIDHFKEINDQHGHPQGDTVIREVTSTIIRTKRDADELFRYGGEEFALLCPEALPGAKALAERIGAAVAGIPHRNLNRQVTISIGIATFPAHVTDFEELIARADAALYEAKARGRNRVCSATDVQRIAT